jgi:hypothetical protein
MVANLLQSDGENASERRFPSCPQRYNLYCSPLSNGFDRSPAPAVWTHKSRGFLRRSALFSRRYVALHRPQLQMRLTNIRVYGTLWTNRTCQRKSMETIHLMHDMGSTAAVVFDSRFQACQQTLNPKSAPVGRINHLLMFLIGSHVAIRRSLTRRGRFFNTCQTLLRNLNGNEVRKRPGNLRVRGNEKGRCRRLIILCVRPPRLNRSVRFQRSCENT